MPWWLMPAALFGASSYVKTMGSRDKFRWIAQPELDVRNMSIFAAVTNAEHGNALPAPPSGTHWKPIQLTMSAVSPLSAPTIVEIHVLVEDPPVQGTAGFLTIEHLAGLGRHHHHHGGRGWGGGWYGPAYVEPLYIEQIPITAGQETWIVDWKGKDGSKQSIAKPSELEARRLKDALGASGIVATISRGGVV
jgi:hypothetical protein